MSQTAAPVQKYLFLCSLCSWRLLLYSSTPLLLYSSILLLLYSSTPLLLYSSTPLLLTNMLNTNWTQHRTDFQKFLPHLGRTFHWNALTSTTRCIMTHNYIRTFIIMYLYHIHILHVYADKWKYNLAISVAQAMSKWQISQHEPGALKVQRCLTTSMAHGHRGELPSRISMGKWG